jgi:hypothetical protein
MNERWESRIAGRQASDAGCVPGRGELEELLRQASCDGLTRGSCSDPVFLSAVETLLRHAGTLEQQDIHLTYGETILKLWSDQKIRFRFVECLGQVIDERRMADFTEGEGAPARCLPGRGRLEALLDQTAFDWVEERRRAVEAGRGGEAERCTGTAVLSFS